MRPPIPRDPDRLSDSELLAAACADWPDAFALFYRRYEDAVLRMFVRRAGDAELAADLMAETFAAALISLWHEGADQIRSPLAWLLRIAHNKLVDSYRRGRVEVAARKQLALDPLAISDEDILRVEELAGAGEDLVAIARRELPAAQWEALRARVIDEREYSDIARTLRCSELVVRKRVSRALRALRLIAREAR